MLQEVVDNPGIDARDAVAVVEVAVGDGSGGIIAGYAWAIPDDDGFQLRLLEPDCASN